MIRLSKTSKLDGILSWSLQAVDTCPGARGANGELVPACAGCYATTGNYRFKNVKLPRLENKEAWKSDSFVPEMVKALDNSRFFRWFDSGDVYCTGLAEKILEVMEKTPHVQHWLPTRMHKFTKFAKILGKMQALGNVVVRFSSDSVCGETVKGETTSTIFSDEKQLQKNAFICKAYENDGKCNGCRACYDKKIDLVAYKAHGVKMNKIIKLHVIS
jgi:hypothetical protein